MRSKFLLVPALFVTAVLAADEVSDGKFTTEIHATVVATGIPGVGAIAQIGPFHRGSPVHDKPAFSAYTQPGRVLDGSRLFVASTSNFGAPLGNQDQYAGTILSIDPSSRVDVPADFALAGDQASAWNGAVQVYSSNSTVFFNSRFNPNAVTANQTGVSLPLGISTNNGHGRPWIANAPYGASGDGKVSVLDPVGAPLAGAPSPVAGGIFMGNLTNRNAASTHGLTTATIGTAIISRSSDRSNRAVFAAVNADGSIVQIHVQKGVDGLLPPGTLTPLTNITPEAAESNDPRTVVRAGIAINWAPTRIIYVADPLANRVLAIDLSDDGTLFVAATPRVLGRDGYKHVRGDRDDRDDRNDLYNIPVDVVPSVPETAADNFSSNSMLAVGADLYVLNRGNNSIVRITQRGRLVAKRYIHVDGQIGFRAAGLAVSPDGQTIWVTGQTKNRGGIVVKIPAFGSGPIMSSLMSQAKMQGASTLNSLGEFFFTKSFSIAEGVGPLFNAQSCVACHGEPKTGGMSATNFVALVDGAHGPVARAHSITELGAECSLQTGPVGATVVSLRSSMSLRNTSLIDFVQPHDIILGAAAQPVDVRGRVNYTADGRVGRFGWKANVPTLIEFMGDGFRNEMGLTNGLHRTDLASGCGSDRVRPELDAVPLVTTAAFLATVDAPAPNASCTSSHGATVFKNTGCTSCHRPSFPGPGGVPAVLYSDLLLHDMGAALADGLAQESATGAEFRTMTLVAMSERSHYLHDGRAKTLQDAILMHGGQATASKNAYQGLSAADQGALTAFLGCL